MARQSRQPLVATAFNPDWGPYRDAADARTYLCRYADAVCGPHVGIAWATARGVCPLRSPVRDSGGFGDTLVFDWQPTKPALARRMQMDFWTRARQFVSSVLIQVGKSEITQAEMQTDGAMAVGQMIRRVAASHSDDGLGVALDIVCVGISLALIPTGLGAIGLIALMGASTVLYYDGKAYGEEMTGDDAASEETKKNSEVLRLIATVATLPDVAIGTWKVFCELSEVRSDLVLDMATASAARSMSQRTTNAQRADRYREVVERAHQRAQARVHEVKISAARELTPRFSGLGSMSLLIKEEFSGDDTTWRRFINQLQLHTVAIQR